MIERDEPPSDFLRALIGGEVPLAGHELAEINLQRLITTTRDDDPENREWATLLLARQEIDTAEIRAALLAAADDDEEAVRAEAILGLAQRDKALALPLVQRGLAGSSASMALFEAAALLADPCLVDELRLWASSSDDDPIDQSVIAALRACERAGPRKAKKR